MRFDAIVIGSGQGGNPLTYGLAKQGWKVALIEQAQLGGTCVNTGCTPTKSMVACAQVAYYARDAERWGVHTGEVSVDLGRIVDRTRAIVERFRGGHQSTVDDEPNITLFRGHGRFTAPGKVAVNDEVLESGHIYIDTGARPQIPPIDGIQSVDYLDNASLMQLRQVPEHLLVLGGGYIGMEFGQMFRRFGSRVTLIHRGEEVLDREDRDVVAELRAALTSEGVQFLISANATAVRRSSQGIALTIEVNGEQQTVEGSHLLVATGRRPNTDDLGLELAGVETDQRGYVRVNSRLETTAPGVWALGDVKGGPAFTHISYNDYQIIYGNLVEGKDLSTEGRPVPYAVFTDPQLGRVGMTETEARKSGRGLKIGTYPMSRVARAIERDETAGMMKVVVDAETDKILGASILSSEGGELVQLLGFVMLAGAPYTLLKGAIYIHPTLAEGFYGLMDAVRPVDGRG